MYLRDLTASLLRRWYLVAVVVAVTLGAAVGVARVVGPSYEQNAAVLLLPPATPGSPDTNRYLALGGLSQATDVLVRALTSESGRTAAAARAGLPASAGKDFTAAVDPTSSAPVIIVTAKTTSVGLARAVLTAAVAEASVTLARLQQQVGIGAADRIDSVVLTRDPRPEIARASQFRISLVAAVGVGALGLLGVGAADTVLARRRDEAEDAGGVGEGLVDDPRPHGLRHAHGS